MKQVKENVTVRCNSKEQCDFLFSYVTHYKENSDHRNILIVCDPGGTVTANNILYGKGVIDFYDYVKYNELEYRYEGLLYEKFWGKYSKDELIKSLDGHEFEMKDHLLKRNSNFEMYGVDEAKVAWLMYKDGKWAENYGKWAENLS